jgi:hypothetical protein
MTSHSLTDFLSPASIVLLITCLQFTGSHMFTDSIALWIRLCLKFSSLVLSF